MDKNLEDPLPIHELAQLLGISVRQLERWFKTYFNKSPQQYYAEVRLQHAKRSSKPTNPSWMWPWPVVLPMRPASARFTAATLATRPRKRAACCNSV